MKFTLVTVLAGLVALALATPTYHQNEEDVKTLKETGHQVHGKLFFVKFNIYRIFVFFFCFFLFLYFF